MWHRKREPDAEDEVPDDRMEALETRVTHLEAALEGLQDSVYRETQRLDEALAELRKRLEPEALSKSLSEDARRRGI